MKKNLGKNLFIAVMLCFMVCCGIIMVSLNSNASKPLTKWVIVTIDKLDIETAEFIFGN